MSDGTFTGPAFGGLVGSAVAIVGDVDGDGFDDIVIGNFRGELGGQRVGAAYLIYGRAAGFQGTTALTNADAVFYGAAIDSGFGAAVSAAGDVDGDGLEDFLVGASAEQSASDGIGRIYLFPGSPTRYAGSYDLAGSNWPGQATFEDDDVGGMAGERLSPAGDVDGDGFDDFLVGAPHWGRKLSNNVGAAFLVYGGFSWGAAPLDLASLATTIRNDRPDSFLGMAVGGRGDLDGDGLSDFVIGDPAGNSPGPGGRVVMFYGTDQRLPASVTAGDAAAQIMSAHPNGWNLGLAAALAGDVNGDGLDDLLIGSPAEDSDVAYLIYGHPDRLLGAQDVSIAGAWFQGSIMSSWGPLLAGAGDVNGDGFADLLIHGMDTENFEFPVDTVHLFLGGSPPLQGSIPLSGAAVTYVSGLSEDPCTGSTGTAVSGGGDVDGDGYDDYLIGDAGQCLGGESAGRVFLVRGGPWR